MSETGLELRKEPSEAEKAWSKIRAILQAKPAKKDVKSRGYEYIPIGIQEDKLDKIFGDMNWQTKNVTVQIVFNELIVTLELWVRHPVSGDWIVRSGTGAAQIRCHKLGDLQKEANTRAIKNGQPVPFPTIDASRKIQNGIEMDLPHAKANAFKNACIGLGKFFGRDLRRKDDESGYYYAVEIKVAEKEAKRAQALKEVLECGNTSELKTLENKWVEFGNDPQFTEACNERYNELKAEE